MKVLFICRSNAGRSQMAEAFFNKLSVKAKATSAGTHADARKNLPDFVIGCMGKLGYNISRKKRKKVSKSLANTSDKIVVIMEPKERYLLPNYLRNPEKVVYWSIPDASGTTYKFHCSIRDKIKKRVAKLIKEIE